MATTKKSSKATAPAKAAPAKAATAKTEAKSEETRPVTSSAEEQMSFDREREHLDEPSEALRGGFRRLISDDAARELGSETKSGATIHEARHALVGAASVIKEHGARVRYPTHRLRYAMDLLANLEARVAFQNEASKGSRDRASRVVRTEADAAAARKELIAALEPVVSADADEEAAFSEARGSITDNASLIKSLEDLVAMGRRWLTHRDGELRALAHNQGLTEPGLQDALRKAHALQDALADSGNKDARSGRDAPETNVLEGRVLFELKALYEAIERNRPSPDVALPDLGPTVRRALWEKKAAKKGDGAAKKGGDGKAKGDAPTK